MNSTPLSFLVDVMDQHQDFANIEEQYKVRAIDTALRGFRRSNNYPWNLKKGTLRVFAGISEYPITADHDELGYVDKQTIDNYGDTARFYNTTIKQFYEEVNSYRNLMADIWKDGTRFIGLKLKDEDMISTQLSDAETIGDYTASDDASDIVLDKVVYKEGNGSIKFTVDNSAEVATIENTINTTSDSDYKTKYHFRWIYLSSVPDYIEMRLQTDSANYLKTNITTQFAGNVFVADDWNLIAYDLNTATEEGTFDENSITGEKVILSGAESGEYRLDRSYLKQWKLMDKWYYSKYNVISDDSSTPDREYFIPITGSSADINLLDELLGDSKWIDIIVGKAMRVLLADINNVTLLSWVNEFTNEAKREFGRDYPNMTPLITKLRRRFNNDPGRAYLINSR